MKHELKKALFSYFCGLVSRTEEEKLLTAQLESELDYFDITSVSRYDLETKDFDPSGLSDYTMQRIASKMEDRWLNNGYWEDLKESAYDVGVKDLLLDENGE